MYKSKDHRRDGFHFYRSEVEQRQRARQPGPREPPSRSPRASPSSRSATGQSFELAHGRRGWRGGALAGPPGARLESRPPGFIPMRRGKRFFVPIGQWVLEEACREAKGWQRDGKAPVKVAVNISGIQFIRSDLAEVVDTVLTRCGLPARALELEIAEYIMITTSNSALETIRRIHAMGVSFAVDDFGTGFSSLAYLKRFPSTRSRWIDRSFAMCSGIARGRRSFGPSSSWGAASRFTRSPRGWSGGAGRPPPRGRLSVRPGLPLLPSSACPRIQIVPRGFARAPPLRCSRPGPSKPELAPHAKAERQAGSSARDAARALLRLGGQTQKSER